MKQNTPITILFATSILEERLRFLDLVQFRKYPYTLLFPQDLREADGMLTASSVDIIVTDLTFAGGTFADWLVLWPRPFILLSYYGEEERLDSLIGDEACSYLMRDADNRHLSVLPTMIRKVLNIRESINRQNTHMQISERRYLDLVCALPDIVYTLDGDGRFLYINDSILQLGFKPQELIGQHFSSIISEEDIPRVSRDKVLPDYTGVQTGDSDAPKLFDERRSGSRMTKNLEVRLKNKPPVDGDSSMGIVYAYGEVSCVGYALPEYDGGDIGTVGIIRDVTKRKESEFRLLEDLRIKEMIIKEIHHRVKNNLQVVSSLLNLQGGNFTDEKSRSIFLDCQNQIQAMAMVHEQLYRSDNLQTIAPKAFLTSLLVYLLRVFDVDGDRVRSAIQSDIPDIGIDQAIPLALIVNELVSNAIKHGLVRQERGVITVSLKAADGDMLLFELSDNGVGLPEDFVKRSESSMGFQLVRALVSQLGGTISWKSDGGAHFTILFPVDTEGNSRDF